MSNGRSMVRAVRVTGHPTATAVDLRLDSIHKLADHCMSFRDFMVFNACGGGNGSDLGSLMLLRMLVDYGNMFRLRLTVWSCLLVATAVGAKYDAVISEHSILLS